MKKPPEKDTSERWLLTYSDLMNLLLILFIVLYSMSKTDVQKAQAVAESIRNAINGTSQVSQVASSNASAAGNVSGASSSSTDYSDFYDQLIGLIQRAGMQGQVEVVADSSDVVITLKDSALYASGSPDMNQDARSLMSSIGGLLTQVNFELVMVEGYTDNDPMHSATIPDNLELSTKRANGVNRVLQQAGVPAQKIVSMGYGENNPVAPNDTQPNKALNRRVVLTIFKNTKGLTPNEIIAAKELLGKLNGTSSTSGTSSVSSSSSSTSSSASSSSSKPSSSSSKSSSSSSKTSSSSKSSH